MSYKWPDKDPDEIIDYSVDWSRFLGSDTITATTWYVDDASGNKTLLLDSTVVNGLQFVTGTISGQVATARFSLGTTGVRYNVTCSILTGSGLLYERTIYLRVKEK